MSVFSFLQRRNRRPAADGLEPDVLDAAQTLRSVSARESVPAASSERARARMLFALRQAEASARLGEPSSPRGRGFFGTLASRRRIAFAAGLAALMLLLTAGGLSRWQGDGGPLISPSAEAVVIQGTLASQGTGTLVLSTDAGSEVVMIGGEAQVVDAVGNPISLATLLPGQAISVRGHRDERSGIVVSEVKAVKEIHGIVVSFSPTLLRLTSPKGSFDLVVTPATKVEGVVTPGVSVEVEIGQDSSGALVAVEIEAEGEDDEDEHGTPARSGGPQSQQASGDSRNPREAPAGAEGAAGAPPIAAERQPTRTPVPTATENRGPNEADDDDDRVSAPVTPQPRAQSTPLAESGADDACDPDEDDYMGDDEDDSCPS